MRERGTEVNKRLTGLIVACSLFWVSANASAGEDVLTLDQCIDEALKSNLNLEVAGEKVQESEATIKEASTYFLPKLSSSAGVTRQAEAPTMYFGPLGGKIPVGEENVYNASASLSQPLFTGGKILNGYIVAGHVKSVSEWGLEAAKKDVIRDVTQAYYTVLAAKRSLVALDTSIVLLTQIVKDLKNAVDVGMRGEHELLQSQVKLQNQKMVRRQAANGVIAATGQLGLLMGRQMDHQLAVCDSISEPDSFQMPSLDTLIQRVDIRQPELKQMEHQLRILDLNAKIADAIYYPSVFANAGFTGQTQGLRADNSFEFKDSWTVSLMLQWNIFDWGAAREKRKQIESQIRQTELSMKDVKNKMKLAVQTGYLSLKDAFDNIAVTSTSIVQSKRAYDITYDKFQQGLVPNSELLTAQSSRLESEISYYRALSDYYSKRADLEYLISSK